MVGPVYRQEDPDCDAFFKFKSLVDFSVDVCRAVAGRFELPKWADVVKTSKARELPPMVPWNLKLRAHQNVCFVV